MGCCISTEDEQHCRRHPDGGAKPPAPPLEEETVKEVLLETPIIPKAASRSETIKPKPLENQMYIEPEIAPARVTENRNPHRKNMPSEEKEVTVSEASEMCSFSEGISNTTAPEKNDDADGFEINQRQPASKVRDHGGERRRVPAKRPTAPSPEKRGSAAPSRRQRRNVEKEKKRGEEGRHRSVSKTVENGGGNDGRVAADDAVLGDPEAESLENPVVSLECFIFL